MSLQARFWLWSAALLALAAVFTFGVRKDLQLETDILALLPEAERDAGASEALRKYSDGVARKALFLVGAPEPAQARAAAQRFAETLRAAQVFEQVRFEIDAASAGTGDLYAPYRDGLLSPRVRQLLLAGQGGKLQDEALHAIYSPGVAPRPLPVAQDPLNLFGDFLAQTMTAVGAAQPRDGVLTLSDQRLHYVMVGVVLSQGPFAMAAQERMMPVIEAALAEARATPGVEVLGSGLILHAAAATRSATQEISTVGTLSLVGVVLMVLLTFRSPRPLLLSALALGAGALAAITACHFIFGRIHLITLVFGTGLIGVAIDYSNHFLADQFRNPREWTPAQALQHVGSGIAMGMSCAVLGYLGLALAPLPGLRQMAVFSAVGLFVSCASVLLLYPLLARPARRLDAPLLLRLALRFDRALGHVRTRWLVAALIVLGAFGLWRLQFADDVRLLQSSTPQLLQQEQAVRSLLRSAPDSRLFLVRGATPDAVLAAEEQLRERLDALIDSGALSSYLALSRALPSPQRQLDNRALLAQQVYQDEGPAERLLTRLGFAPEVSARNRADFAARPALPLLLQDWLPTPAAEPYRTLWLDRIDGGYASVVALVGVRDVAALAAVASPGAIFIDKVADISAVLGRYRELAALLIAGIYSFIGLLLALRYGALTALRLLAVPVGAALLTLAVFGLLGLSASLFNVLALFLVLGLGVDYAIFLREGREARAPTLLALSLSTLGTVLSYGLLAFSATPFIRSLGLTLLVGISLTFVFALLSQRDS